MEDEQMVTTPPQGQRMFLELLSKEEIIQKYKGLLVIAKKAKQAKDETFKENCILKEQLHQYETEKEADKKSLMTMKEMLEAYTENKLQLATQVSELQKLQQLDSEKLEKFSIESESLQRQLQRLTEDNESLLRDIENMEGQLKHVSGLSKGQKQQLLLQEKETTQLKESEVKNNQIRMVNDELNHELQELREKYKFIKYINTEQRCKFNSLKDRFIEVYKKLKKLKECKRILLETQHEYADAVSQWQNEIIKASNILCKELNDLKEENIKLLKKLDINKYEEHNSVTMQTLNELLILSEKAKQDYNHLQVENEKLNQIKTTKSSSLLLNLVKKIEEIVQLSPFVFQEYNDIRKENVRLKQEALSQEKLDSPQEFGKCYINSLKKVEELDALVITAVEDYQQQSKEIATLKLNIEKLIIENEYSKKECTQLEGKINLLQQEKHSMINNAYAREYTDQEHASIYSCNNDSLEDSLKKSQVECQQLAEELKALEIISVQEKVRLNNISLELNNVRAEKIVLQDKIEKMKRNSNSTANLKEELLSTKHLFEEYTRKYKHKEIEHSELLDEMRELNEALKARGDLISRQQEEHQVLKNELKTNACRLSKIQHEIDNKDLQLSEKQNEILTITKEITITKEKLENLQHVNLLSEEKVKVLSIELDNVKLNASASTVDFDNHSDILSTSTISRADELQRLKDVEDSFEDKYHKLRSLAAKLKKKLQEETLLKQRFEKDIKKLSIHEQDLNSQIVELKNKVPEIDSLNKLLNEKQKNIDILKTEIHKLKTSRKQANVLTLEIEAAEKSLTEVANKLAKCTLELKTAEESIKSKDSTIAQLRKEIDLLESSKSSEIKHSQELKQQIDQLHKTVKDEIHSKQLAYEKSKLFEQSVENLNQQLENIKIEFAQYTSNQEVAVKFLSDDRDQLNLQLSTMQAKLLDCKEKLKKAERGAEDLQLEYLDYKVKAQAVLRKNQNRDSSKERELEEELLAMRAIETRLNDTIERLNSKMESFEKQKNILNDDNASLLNRSQELMLVIEEIRAQNDALNNEIQHNIQQQHESLKQYRQQMESVDVCHQEQIQILTASHQRQLEQMRKELSQNIRLPTTIGETKSTSLPPHTFIDCSNDQGKLDFFLMEREDAEGSEEAAETLANLAASRKISHDFSTAKRFMQDFMPLDQLLNTPLNALTSETLITNSEEHQNFTDRSINASNTTEILQLELNSTKDRLQKEESRVRHLTALLAENEQDLAKLTQMNDMLKEELRRQERSMEREQHMHNSEYLKNVIIKFLTLNNADEKSRLVPVLNTILKLNRSEAEMLDCVAKGQKVSDTTHRTGGWVNFLPWGSNSNND